MKKKDINEFMLFKLGHYGLCVLLPRKISSERDLNKYILSNKKVILEDGLRLSGSVELNMFSDDLLYTTVYDEVIDIIAVKQCEHVNEVLYYVLNDVEPEEWDWVREEKKYKRELVDYKDRKYGVEGKITPYTYKNQTLHVGDIVKIESLRTNFKNEAFICYDEYGYYIMGVQSACDGKGNLDNWEIIELVKKYYDVEDNEVCGDLKMVNKEIKKIKIPVCKRSRK